MNPKCPACGGSIRYFPALLADSENPYEPEFAFCDCGAEFSECDPEIDTIRKSHKNSGTIFSAHLEF